MTHMNFVGHECDRVQTVLMIGLIDSLTFTESY